jgi:5-methylcytosine-specific restriction endonuclease McrA
MLTRRKSDIIEKKDGRIELRGVAYAKMKAKLRELADSKCERCGKFTLQGDVEHIVGRGGGKRDDRIFVDGKRNLEYLCRVCHSGRHIPDKVVPAKMNDSEFNSMLGLGE